MTDRPRVLIEDWLPVAGLSVESRREREVVSSIPDLFALHMWWARRPLVASAGVILGSLMPAWSPALAAAFPDDIRVQNSQAYRRWFLHLCGIDGDPVSAKAAIEEAKDRGRKVVEKSIYGYERAFGNRPNYSDLALLHGLLVHTWGDLPNVIDPTAGGGSIPYEAARYGLPVIANDLNAVAASVLRAGVDATATYGASLVPDLQRFGALLVERMKEKLIPYFPLEDPRERVVGYIFARCVPCPRTGKPTPLAPNWWMSNTAGQEAAIKVVTSRGGKELSEAEFEVVLGAEAKALSPSDGSISNGTGISVWDSLPIEGDYIKKHAQAGTMTETLCGVAIRRRTGSGRWTRAFRGPSAVDLAGLDAAREQAEEELSSWLRDGRIPSESIGTSNYDRGHRLYGVTDWHQMFSRRQLLVQARFVEVFRDLSSEITDELGTERGSVVVALLGLMQGKALAHGSKQSRWDPGSGKVCNAFEKHNFSFKWAFAEYDAARELYAWAFERLVANFAAIASLYLPSHKPYAVSGQTFGGSAEDVAYPVPGPVTVLRGSAAELGAAVPSKSQTLVCIDPPYYDNVMYGELSDFFGVWEQHTIGAVWPELMPGGLADQTNEAVANVARFRGLGGLKRMKELATADYQAKMHAIFSECQRVLRDDGVMTVMFTHKRAEAWDTLGMALMEAGFEVATSWPVNTESEQSLHQAKKNAAASTVMLVCRKRPTSTDRQTFFEDLLPAIKTAARDSVARFEADGINGVDLLLSTYGPVLSVISAAWPVYSSEAAADGSARLLRPEEALDVAREELVDARRRFIVGRQVTFDPVTDFWLIAWELFQAEEFPYDEARRLALAVGGQDPERLAAAGILTKKAGTVLLQAPADRRRRVLRPVQDGDFESLSLVDILHGVLVTADLDGLAAAKTLMDRHGLTTEPRFLALVQGSVNAVPRTKKKGAFIRPEAATLDALVTAYLPFIAIPEDEPSDTLFDVD